MARAFARCRARGKNLSPGAVLDALGGGWSPRGLASPPHGGQAGPAAGSGHGGCVWWKDAGDQPACRPAQAQAARRARRRPRPRRRKPALRGLQFAGGESVRPVGGQGAGARLRAAGPPPAGEEPQGDESPAPRGHGKPPAGGRTRPAVRRAALRVRDGHPARAETRSRGSVHGQRGPRRRRGDARPGSPKTAATCENAGDSP